jgi:hypothetical protein
MDSVSKKILITVKTYPSLSIQHGEIVCTAGVLEDGSWIRLYPIKYRYSEYSQWYKKYQWIEILVEKHPHDHRLESYIPRSDIKVGEFINAKSWNKRKQVVLLQGTKEMCWLNEQQQQTVSLAIIYPKSILDFYWEPTEREWPPQQLVYMNQMRLFDKNDVKPLEKIPIIFRYHFECNETRCKGHKMMIADWEVMELFRKMRDNYGEEMGLKKVKEKFLDHMCSAKRDTYFYVGTVYLHNTWIITGVFWPPKNS